MFNKTLPISDYFLELGKGDIPRHSLISKFGENPLITVGGFETVWDGTGKYIPPTQSRFHNVASDSDEDKGLLVSSGTATGGSVTSLVDSAGTFQTDLVAAEDIILNDEKMELGEVVAVLSETEISIARRMRDPHIGLDGLGFAGGDAYRIARDDATGAAVIHIIGLSTFFQDQEEFVILNGLADVQTVFSYPRQFRARIFTSANPAAIGTITSTTIGETVETVSLQIIDGNNQTLMAIYTVPTNKIGIITRWWASMSKKQSATSVLKLRVGQLPQVGYIEQVRSIQSAGASSFDYPFKAGAILPGGADVWMECDADAASVGVAGGFDVVEVTPIAGGAFGT